MPRFFQPVLSVVLGLALSVYGVIHAAKHLPGLHQLHAFWTAMPSMAAVLVFLLGVIAVVTGMVLLSTGVQGLRRRVAQVSRLYGEREEPFDEEGYGRPAYYRG